jgi:carbon monoxide dehydrogenase subunit G
MPEVSESVVIAASSQEVFDVLTDPNRAPEWSSTARTASGPSPVSLEEEFTIEGVFLGKTIETTFTVHEHERPTRYAYAATSPLRVAMAADLAEADAGTQVTVSIDLDPGLIFAAAGPLLKRQMRKQLRGDLESLRALLEP